MLIRGKSFYTRTRTPLKDGKYNVGNYTVGVKDFEIVKGEEEFDITPFVKSVTDKETGVTFDTLSIQNSKYPPKMYDKDKIKLEENITVPKDTDITISVVKRHNKNFNTDYLICNGIMLNEDVEEYNPFA